MLMDISPSRFDIYEGTGAKLFYEPLKLLMPSFFSAKRLSDVRFEIHLVQRNIVSNRQSDWADEI